MEFHHYDNTNPFESHFQPQIQQCESLNQKCPYIPVEVRLKQNKDRRLIIEKEKQKQKQQILQKRKQKEDNVQKILKQKQEARENAKLVFGNMQKTFSNRFDDPAWARADDIQDKIQQCRDRAVQYKTMYKKKIRDNMEDKQKGAKERRKLKDREEKDRSLNFHLAQWRDYEKRIAEKYRGEPKGKNRLYEGFVKKQQQLRSIVDKYKQDHEEQRKTVPPQSNGFRPIIVKDRSQRKIEDQSTQKDQTNSYHPIIQISSLGLSKSIKNPNKMLKQMQQFLDGNLMLEDPINDESLVAKFEEYLYKSGNDA